MIAAGLSGQVLTCTRPDTGFLLPGYKRVPVRLRSLHLRIRVLVSTYLHPCIRTDTDADIDTRM